MSKIDVHYYTISSASRCLHDFPIKLKEEGENDATCPQLGQRIGIEALSTEKQVVDDDDEEVLYDWEGESDDNGEKSCTSEESE